MKPRPVRCKIAPQLYQCVTLLSNSIFIFHFPIYVLNFIFVKYLFVHFTIASCIDSKPSFPHPLYFHPTEHVSESAPPTFSFNWIHVERLARRLADKLCARRRQSRLWLMRRILFVSVSVHVICAFDRVGKRGSFTVTMTITTTATMAATNDNDGCRRCLPNLCYACAHCRYLYNIKIRERKRRAAE